MLDMSYLSTLLVSSAGLLAGINVSDGFKQASSNNHPRNPNSQNNLNNLKKIACVVVVNPIADDDVTKLKKTRQHIESLLSQNYSNMEVIVFINTVSEKALRHCITPTSRLNQKLRLIYSNETQVPVHIALNTAMLATAASYLWVPGSTEKLPDSYLSEIVSKDSDGDSCAIGVCSKDYFSISNNLVSSIVVRKKVLMKTKGFREGEDTLSCIRDWIEKSRKSEFKVNLIDLTTQIPVFTKRQYIKAIKSILSGLSLIKLLLLLCSLGPLLSLIVLALNSKISWEYLFEGPLTATALLVIFLGILNAKVSSSSIPQFIKNLVQAPLKLVSIK